MNPLNERTDVLLRFVVRIVAEVSPSPFLEEETRAEVPQRFVPLLVRNCRTRLKRTVFFETIER